MTEIAILNPALTMTSREITDLINENRENINPELAKSRHDNVKVAIDRLVERGVI
jgi:hypothetical protein